MNEGAIESLRGRSFLKDADLTGTQLLALIELAAELKAARRGGTEEPRLRNKHIALVFEKPSTRTRCAFEVAAHDQGAHVTYLDPLCTHVGQRESVKDTARVLGRMYDGIEFRGRSQDALETLARHAAVPVWNGLTDLWHPTQAICDMLTVREHSTSHWFDLTVAYLGDGTSNVANSLRVAGSLLGMSVRIVSPRALRSSEDVVRIAAQICAATGGTVVDTDDVDEGVRGADFLYTDVWVRIGEPAAQWSERVALLRPYRVDREILARTKNPEVKFMHCLPALHDGHTTVGKEFQAVTGLDSAEVTDDVFESPASIVFDQAENRMHTIKALMVATLGAAIR